MTVRVRKDTVIIYIQISRLIFAIFNIANTIWGENVRIIHSQESTNNLLCGRYKMQNRRVHSELWNVAVICMKFVSYIRTSMQKFDSLNLLHLERCCPKSIVLICENSYRTSYWLQATLHIEEYQFLLLIRVGTFSRQP